MDVIDTILWLFEAIPLALIWVSIIILAWNIIHADFTKPMK